ncbi:MAG TPA: PDZ domain-containing protein [Pirellulales bacterium]|nr:PDZ domain-containing protein [Pirellulales bacterium]
MRKLSLGLSSPGTGTLATALVALLAIAAPAIGQSSSSAGNRDNDDSSARSNSREGSSDEDRSSGRSSQSGRQQSDRQQSDRQQSGASLGVVLYNDDSNALEIRRVMPQSAAEEAGLQRGDEIISVNGRRVSSVDQLKRQISRAGADEEIEIGILRNGRKQTVEANLSSRRDYASRSRGRSQQQWNQGNYGRNEQYGQNQGYDDYGDEGYQGRQGYQGWSSRNNGYAQNYGNRGSSNQNYGNRGYGNQQYGNRGYGNRGNEQYGDEEYGDEYGGQNQGYANRGQGYGNQNYGQYGGRSYSRGSRQTDNGQDEDDDRYSQGFRGSQGSDRAFLGVTLDENARDRVRVNDIYPNSPAAEAGLRRGDEIVAVDDEDVRSNRDLQRLLSQKDPDDDVSITVERNGRERTLRAMLASQQEVFAAERSSYRTGRRNNYNQDYGDQNDYRNGRRGQSRNQDDSDNDTDDNY